MVVYEFVLVSLLLTRLECRTEVPVKSSLACRDDGECMFSPIPSSHLAALVSNRTEGEGRGRLPSDVYVGDNLLSWPDVSDNDSGLEYYTFTHYLDLGDDLWSFRSTDSSVAYLKLDGVSYNSTVYVDGVEVYKTEGLFERHMIALPVSFDEISIKVAPPPSPGIPSGQCPNPPVPNLNCGQGGDHSLARSAGAMQFVAGWDWIQGIPDRTTGLVAPVSLVLTEGVRVEDPMVTTLFLAEDHSHAVLSSSVRVRNDLETSVSGYVDFSFGGCRIRRVRLHELEPFEIVDVDFDSFTIDSPNLWWPHTLGDPYLHNASFDFILDDESLSVSDSVDFKVGIRTFHTSIDEDLGGRSFSINGVRTFLQGGNWITPDAMLTLNSNERYFQEVLLHQRAGLNLIRVWGGGLTERPAFYDACDELGMLVMQEFWMSGDNNGRWGGNYDDPLDHSLYLRLARDSILSIRYRASLLFYGGGNELYPKQLSPPGDIQEGLADLVSKLDPTRFFILSSMDGGNQGSNMDEHDPNFALCVKDGPYGYLDPITFFAEPNPGLINGTDLVIPFQPEIGASSFPSFRGLKKMGLDQVGFPGENGVDVPTLWDFHNYEGFTFTSRLNSTVDAVYSLGAPTTVQDFAARARLAQIQQTQSLFEGFGSKMFMSALEGGKSAVFFWKTQSPWPALRGFLYDWWLETTGTFEGIKAGTGGGPNAKKLQLNLNTMAVEFVNRGRFTVEGLSSAYVDIFNFKGEQIKGGGQITLPDIVNSMTVARSDERVNWDGQETVFVRISGKGFEDVWYWLKKDNDGGLSSDYRDLGIWRDSSSPASKVNMTHGSSWEEDHDTKGKWWTMKVKVDVEEAVLFGGTLTVLDEFGERLLPTLIDGLPIVVLPGGSVNVDLRLWSDQVSRASQVVLESWNGETIFTKV